ncbi:hypothetical protein Y1Q_0000041 [Alligator mississippiensis]|uniref:Uncharacterized protein n=1 Tax=Alligator mississippiensis TaxID=8496 RepID=A0A151NTW4_ALLMI|nr:hypothetical protein Y1Q_0000041 [Alligator mississippiensis]
MPPNRKGTPESRARSDRGSAYWGSPGVASPPPPSPSFLCFTMAEAGHPDHPKEDSAADEFREIIKSRSGEC